MKVAYIAAGAGGMICGNCLRDNALAAALIELGHDVELIPTYTPLRTDEANVSLDRVFYGGISVYLRQMFPLFRWAPEFVNDLLDQPGLLRWASGFALKTLPEDLGALTVSTLEGSGGPQRDQLEKLIAWLKQSRPDIVHITNSILSSIAPAVKAELGVPVCCSLQGEDYFLSHLPPPYRGRAFELVRELASSVDAFVASSGDHAEVMAPYLGLDKSEIRVVLSGIRLDGFEERRAGDPGEFVIGYMARVAPEKGLDLLADAFVRLRARMEPPAPRCKLRVAGWLSPQHESYLDDVGRRLEEAGAEADFEYLGTLNRAAKIDFLRGLDVLSVPVRYPAAKGLYVLEALAAGVPSAQPSIGVFPELAEATSAGVLFETDDVEDLTLALARLAEDRAECEQMGRRGMASIRERFHSRRMAEETLNIYRDLTGEADHGV